MNLKKMFEMQKALDDRIMEEHPELGGRDNLDWKTLALLVEVGECANEWRGFKFWSKDQEPRKEIICHACNGRGVFDQGLTTTIDGIVTAFNEPCLYCEGNGVERFPLLEEYVDGFHFVLSVGLEHDFVEDVLEYYDSKYIHDHKDSSITRQFNRVFEAANGFHGYEGLLYSYLALGEMLGFTKQEIEEAYIAKNTINHQRQSEGY